MPLPALPLGLLQVCQTAVPPTVITIAVDLRLGTAGTDGGNDLTAAADPGQEMGIVQSCGAPSSNSRTLNGATNQPGKKTVEIDGDRAFLARLTPTTAPNAKATADQYVPTARQSISGQASVGKLPELEPIEFESAPATRQSDALALDRKAAPSAGLAFAESHHGSSPDATEQRHATRGNAVPPSVRGANFEQTASLPGEDHSKDGSGTRDKDDGQPEQQAHASQRTAAEVIAPRSEQATQPEVIGKPAPMVVANSPSLSNRSTAPPAAWPPPVAPTGPVANTDLPQAAAVAPALREIAVQVSDSQGGNVALHIVDKAGKIMVDVRTPDADLARILRTDVDHLVSRLEQTGYQVDTWSPGDRAPGVSETANTGQNYSSNSEGDHSNENTPRFGTGPDARQQQERRSQQAWMQYFDDNLNDSTFNDRRTN